MEESRFFTQALSIRACISHRAPIKGVRYITQVLIHKYLNITCASFRTYITSSIYNKCSISLVDIFFLLLYNKDYHIFGGEFGFDGDVDIGVASRCLQSTLKKAN